VEKYGTARQAKDDAHTQCMMDNQGYRHTLGICNTYRFSSATVVAQMHLTVTFVYTLLALLIAYIT
jgi:hypothetical protein